MRPNYVDRVICADNLEFMRSLPSGLCDLIYIDPPFCTGQVRRLRYAEQSYPDSWTGGPRELLEFLKPRLAECHRLLANHATIYVHVDWRISHRVRLLMEELFGEENFLNEIIWHYRTGGVSKRWFGRKHDSIFSFAKELGAHRFNSIRDGQYRTDGLNRDENGLQYKSTKKGRLYFDPAGPLVSDVWDIPFLSTVSSERVDWPTQKPLALLNRIVKASSKPGDVVADFFCGSGTTLVAAKLQNRRYLGCDLSADAVAIAQARLAHQETAFKGRSATSVSSRGMLSSLSRPSKSTGTL